MQPDEQLSGTGPSRGQLVAIFGGLAVLGLLIGVGTAYLTGSDDDPSVSGFTPTVSPTDVPERSSNPYEDDDESADDDIVDEPTPSITGTPNYGPIPEDAGSEPGLDFGFLTRVISTDGTVTLRFDRASFFTGDAAKQRNAGQYPENDYLIENTNPAQRSFDLDPQASIIAANRLLSQPGQVSRQVLTLQEFIQNSTRVLTGSTTDLPVWLRHTDGLAGPVTALAEQYLP